MRALAGWWPSGLLVPSRSVLATVGRRRSGLLTDVLPFPVPLPEAAVEPREEVAVVGMLGRITPWKGQDVFLEAFAQAFPAGDVHARIIGNALFGETDYEHELHAQAARLGIADRVEFTGFRTDVDAELRRLDVLVHASVLPDPLPGVVLEGMGMGLPVVAADAGGNPEHVVDGVNGLLHVPGDVADLARALRRAAGPLTDRAALGRAARESAHRYAPETVVEQILEFYAAVLRAAGRRPQPS
jgi:glycosyltransferase involved in cell wall biosynthesis